MGQHSMTFETRGAGRRVTIKLRTRRVDEALALAEAVAQEHMVERYTVDEAVLTVGRTHPAYEGRPSDPGCEED